MKKLLISILSILSISIYSQANLTIGKSIIKTTTNTSYTYTMPTSSGTVVTSATLPASYSLTSTGIYSALSYTTENIVNKATDLSTNDNTHYPTTGATQTAINNAIAGVNPAVAVLVATTTSLQAGYTYTNGVTGIGATITFTNTALIYDSYTLTTIGQRILVKNETGGNAPYNGIYSILIVGTGTSTPTKLIRVSDFDQASDINNTGAIPIVNGTINGTTSYVVTSNIITVGTDNITFTNFSLNPTTLITSTGTQTLTNKSISGGQITNLGWSLSFIIDGQGVVIGTGTLICKYITQNVHITGWVISEISSPPITTSTTTVAFTSDTYTTYPPTTALVLSVGGNPSLSGVSFNRALNVTPIAVPSGNNIQINITGNSTAKKLQIVLIGTID